VSSIWLLLVVAVVAVLHRKVGVAALVVTVQA
jgi:hypothetical protein